MSLVLRFSFSLSSVTLGYNASGSAVNLTNFGVGVAQDETYGQVAFFDGTANLQLDSESVPATAFGVATRCFSVWVNPASPSSSLFSTGDESAPGGLLRVSLDSSRRVRVQYSGFAESVTGVSVDLGVWSHVLIAYNGSNVQCYVNATLAFDEARDIFTTESALTLGRNTNSNPAFRGHMSDFRLYDHFLSVQDVTDLFEYGPNELLNVDTTVLTVFKDEGIQPEVVLSDGVVAMGNITTRSLTLVAEKSVSGDTEAESYVYLHDNTTSERVCISESLHTLNEEETDGTSCLKLCRTDSSGNRTLQTCVEYGGEYVGLHSASSTGEERSSTINFDGLSFDSNEAAVILGPFSEFRMKYDQATDTLQIQHLQNGEYTTKVEYGR